MTIKELRIKKGLSQIEFAKKLNITQAEYSMLETGVHKPQFKTMSKIAKKLRMPIEEVVKLFYEDNE